MLSGGDVKSNSSRVFFSDLFKDRSSDGVHRMESLCRRVPGVTLTLYTIQRGIMSVEESVKNHPRA